MAQTPKAEAKKAAEFAENAKEIKLPSGSILTKTKFKGKHVREAQRLMDGDQSKYAFSMMSVCALVDGKKVTIEEMDEMDGEDIIAMMSEFEALFT